MNFELLSDQPLDALQRPIIGRITIGGCAAGQLALQTLKLTGTEPTWTPRQPMGCLNLAPDTFHFLPPTAHATWCDADKLRNLGGMQATPEQLNGLSASML
ncbi:MAG: hypothetical protein L0287_35380 [Anaerolineae bacterium]|nr:hypothetical protein [Anaerolineae bacterium]